MSYKEYIQKDLELKRQIAFYQADNETKRVEIAMNNKAIVEVQTQREELRTQYALSEYPEGAA